ncbi:MAG: phosphoribosylglycinamide formyltransferase [Candidatus Dadabacteria bacterium]|nr:phosphoribosylglycinamide formyltransferase [Candidatus Dadabacteria bacterium]MDE0519147.1 phosphoribosylglycinamide formyltransferase [Candidatus Dadabacteria bacterium]MDE0662671.1 phosphoribosylglycinamide formyltransferase [Candidatus Dadabacteria bacterium]
MSKTNVAVFVSGSGTNLQAVIDSGIESANIAVVVCDTPGVMAIERARKHGIPVELVKGRDFESREEFERQIVAKIDRYDIGLVVLAGFMRILTPYFLGRFANRIINIHPSLLPSFPGTNSVRQALDYGVKQTGCTVHFVREEVDAGPIILQAIVPVTEEDTEETLLEKVHAEEHRILPEAIRLFCEGKLTLSGRKVLISF